MENLHLFEMHKLIISYMETMVEFIKHDDERNPIKVLNVRADWKLLQGFVTIIGGVATLLELSGVDWKVLFAKDCIMKRENVMLSIRTKKYFIR